MTHEQIREALKHCLQVLDLAAGEGLHYKAGGETFDAGDAVFDLAKAVGANIANEADIPGVIASLVVDRLTAPADLCGGEVVACWACEGSPAPENNPCAVCGLYAKPRQPAAEAVSIAMSAAYCQGFIDGHRAEGPDPDVGGGLQEFMETSTYRVHATALSSRSATPEVGGEELVERVARALCERAYPNRDQDDICNCPTRGKIRYWQYWDKEARAAIAAMPAPDATRAERVTVWAMEAESKQTTAQIVAWLRGQAEAGDRALLNAIEGSQRRRDLAAGVVAINRAADVIQAGDHLTGGGE